jgi:D-threo-aldose 1-dehydrogenase
MPAMRAFGTTGLTMPPVVFGTSCLGNLYEARSEETKLEILGEILRWAPSPVVLDSAGKYGAGLALEVIGRGLRSLGAGPEQVLISNKLGWLRVPLTGREPTFEPGAWVGLEHDAAQQISYHGILRCHEQGLELLGAPYRPAFVSVHDPDELLGRAQSRQERERAKVDILEAYRALYELKRRGEVRFVGIGAKDWRTIRELSALLELDWVMLACSLTLYTHPPEVVEFVESLARQGIGIINSAVYNSGFLIGGEYFDYRRLSPHDPGDRPLFAWRERFHGLCRRHGVLPAAACVRFAISPPGVASIALNPSEPAHAKANIELVSAEIPAVFWSDMKAAGLLRQDYPYL